MGLLRLPRAGLISVRPFFIHFAANAASHKKLGPRIMKNEILILVAALLAGSVATVFAQKEERRERTIDEIKTEAVHRAEVGQYPLIGLDPADVKEAFESIDTADKDEWAAGFMRVADRYFNEAKSLEKTDPTKANADYIRAWRIYSFGRWPFPASPGKQRSYEKEIGRAHV